MTADNFQMVIDELWHARPFRIFRIELNTGEQFEVDHPRALNVKNGFGIFLSPGGKAIFFDHQSVNKIIGPESKVNV